MLYCFNLNINIFYIIKMKISIATPNFYINSVNRKYILRFNNYFKIQPVINVISNINIFIYTILYITVCINVYDILVKYKNNNNDLYRFCYKYLCKTCNCNCLLCNSLVIVINIIFII